MTVTEDQPIESHDSSGAADGAGQLHLLPRRHNVLRMSEVRAAELMADDGSLLDDENDQTMLINMGPSHPSTHGVLRLMLELNRELKTSLVIVTHDHSIARQMDRVMVLENGRLQAAD